MVSPVSDWPPGPAAQPTSSMSGYAQQPGVERFLAASGMTVARFPRMDAKFARTSPLAREQKVQMRSL